MSCETFIPPVRRRGLPCRPCRDGLRFGRIWSGLYGPPDRVSAAVYEGENYSGTELALNGPISNLYEYQLNDAVSSIRIDSGSWEVCVDKDFRGRCEILTSDSPSLRALQLNNNITSLRPADGHGYGPGPGGAAYGSLTLFDGTGLRGEAISLDRDEPDFGRAGFNDRARSIEVRSGVWELCVDGGYRGRCETIDRSVSDLRDLGLSGNISSVRLISDDRDRRDY
jgi:Beta/Gamma crystallin